MIQLLYYKRMTKKLQYINKLIKMAQTGWISQIFVKNRQNREELDQKGVAECRRWVLSFLLGKTVLK